MRIYTTLLCFLLCFLPSCKKTNHEQALKLGWKLTPQSEVNSDLQTLREALLKAKDDYERGVILTNIAQVETVKGNAAASIKSSQEAIKYQPNIALSHYLLGKGYIDAGRYNDAVRELSAALGMQPDLVVAHFEMGNALYKKELFNDAIGEYRRTVELDPKFYMAHNNMGVLLNGMGKAREAEQCFTRVIAIKPDFAVAYKNLGIICDLRLKEPGRALTYYRKYLELLPNCPERQTIKAWITELGG